MRVEQILELMGRNPDQEFTTNELHDHLTEQTSRTVPRSSMRTILGNMVAAGQIHVGQHMTNIRTPTAYGQSSRHAPVNYYRLVAVPSVR